MGWRDSYNTLIELFPQVDKRLIKGAALEHGSDIGAAADFILNDIIGPEKLNSGSHVVESAVLEHGNDTGSAVGGVANDTIWPEGSSFDNLQGVDAVEGTSNNTSGDLEQKSMGEQSTSGVDGDLASCDELSNEQDSLRWSFDSLECTGENLNKFADCGSEANFLAGKITEDIPGVLSGCSGDVSSDGFPRTGFEFGWAAPKCQDFLLDSGEISSVLRGPSVSEEGFGDSVRGEYTEASDDFQKVNASEDSFEDEGPCSSGHLIMERAFEDASTVLLSSRSTHEDIIESGSIEEKCGDPFTVSDSNAGRPTTSGDIIGNELCRGLSNGVLTENEVGGGTLLVLHEESPALWGLGTRTLLCGVPKLDPLLSGLDGGQGAESDLDNPQMEEGSCVKNLVGSKGTSDSELEESVSSECETQDIQDFDLGEYHPIVREAIARLTGIDSPFFQSATYEDEAPAFGDRLDSQLSMEKSFNSVDEVGWESGHSSSVHVTEMESVDDLVEQAKSDKEVLISTIEDIRALRQKTDEAESAARQSKDAADQGGLDVMSRVEEMRQVVARAREANAAHAGEVYGERAVLATEARELRSRLVQVKAEKARALTVLNEIKASLQSRFDNANREREAADLEKAGKEARARELLAQEEMFLTKIAQESRDLQAESEACTKIFEFLTERGAIVDALQGEVAVLCEDAETLKKDLDGLSCGGGYVHMLSHTTSNGMDSKSGKLSEISTQFALHLSELEEGVHSPSGGSGSLSERKVPVGQGASSERAGWSPLPSLLRELGGSSNHSLRSVKVAGNSASSSRSSVTGMGLPVNQSELREGAEVVEGIKYPSSKTSSPAFTSADRELLMKQMTLFSDDLETRVSGSGNLDIFRIEKPNECAVVSDEEDWDLLYHEKPSSGSSGSSGNGVHS